MEADEIFSDNKIQEADDKVNEVLNSVTVKNVDQASKSASPLGSNNSDKSNIPAQSSIMEDEDEDDVIDSLFPDGNHTNLSQSISVSGFKLAGESLIADANGKSMLSLLRKYHRVSAPAIPTESDINLQVQQSETRPRGLLAFRHLANIKVNDVGDSLAEEENA